MSLTEFAKDRDRILRAAAQVTGKTYPSPGSALPDLFRLAGYRIGRKRMPANTFGFLDVDSRTAFICDDLEGRIPYGVPSVQVRILAEMMGDLRLHLEQIHNGEWFDQDQSALWASVFLGEPTEELSRLEEGYPREKFVFCN